MTAVSAEDLLAELSERRAEALAMGGPDGVAKHHASGRLTVRERLDRLLDADSWFEVGLLAKPELRRPKPIPGDAVVTGYGRIDGRQVAVIGIDSSIVAGTTAPVSMRKQGRLIDTAQRVGLPIVLLCDADGGRVPDVMGWRFSGLPLDFTTFLEAGARAVHRPAGRRGARPQLRRLGAARLDRALRRHDPDRGAGAVRSDRRRPRDRRGRRPRRAGRPRAGVRDRQRAPGRRRRGRRVRGGGRLPVLPARALRARRAGRPAPSNPELDPTAVGSLVPVEAAPRLRHA